MNIQSITSKLTLFCAFLSCLFFSYGKLMNLFMVIWMSAWAIEIIANRSYLKFQKPDRYNLPLYLTIALFVWMFLSVLWSDNADRALTLIGRRIPLLIFPLLALFGMRQQSKFKILLLAFACGTVIYSVIVFIQAHLLANSQVEQIVSNCPNCSYDFQELFVANYNTIKHRTQFGLCQMLSLTSLFYLRHDIASYFGGRKYVFNIIFFILFAVICYIMFRSETRMMLFVAFFLLISFTFILLWENNMKIVAVAVFPVLLFASLIGIKHHPRMQNIKLDKQSIQQFDPRYGQWVCALTCIKSNAFNPLIGEGIGDYTDVFTEEYNKPDYKKYAFLQEIESAHNVFLDQMMELGVIGVLLILSVFITVPLFIRRQETFVFILQTAFIILCYCLIEAALTRATPINAFALFLVFTYWAKTISGMASKNKEISI